MIVIMTLTRHADVFGGVKEGMEADEGICLSTATVSVSARLSGFLHEIGDLGRRFKNLTCKSYPTSWCAVESDHQ